MHKIAKLIVAIAMLLFTFGSFNKIAQDLDKLISTASVGTIGSSEEVYENPSLYLAMEKDTIGGNEVDPFQDVMYQGYIDGDNTELTDISYVEHYIFHGVDIKETALSILNELSDISNTYYQVITSVNVYLYFTTESELDSNSFMLYLYGIEEITLLYNDHSNETIDLRGNQEYYLSHLDTTKRDVRISGLSIPYGEYGQITTHDSYIYSIDKRYNKMQVNFYENNDLIYTKLLNEKDMEENSNYPGYVIYDLTELVNKYCDNYEEWEKIDGNYIEVSITSTRDVQSAYYNLDLLGLYKFSTPLSKNEVLVPEWSETYVEA